MKTGELPHHDHSHVEGIEDVAAVAVPSDQELKGAR
jgi:hypothetical protein